MLCHQLNMICIPLKMQGWLIDLLGLKTLTVIDNTIKRLKLKNIELDISKINHNDKKFSMLSTGEQRVCSARNFRMRKLLMMNKW